MHKYGAYRFLCTDMVRVPRWQILDRGMHAAKALIFQEFKPSDFGPGCGMESAIISG